MSNWDRRLYLRDHKLYSLAVLQALEPNENKKFIEMAHAWSTHVLFMLSEMLELDDINDLNLMEKRVLALATSDLESDNLYTQFYDALILFENRDDYDLDLILKGFEYDYRE